ncbi:hypothetical protein CIRMBP1294_02665 [Enterococcus cecorum]|nr:hypothetical protein CIRMBP1277_00687 [Enterococcus cecorum]CAI3515900.1 hypothetical protein CIRMBP1294_02665 [Enterococcus cecorum]
MKKKILLLLTAIFCVLILTGCNSNNQPKSHKSELETIGLTAKQSKAYKSLIKEMNKSIKMLDELDESPGTITTNNVADILLQAINIEGAYLKAGGKNQDEIVDSLQESVGSICQVANMMGTYYRHYTEAEAFLILGSYIYISNDLAKTWNLNEKQQNKLKEYLLNHLKLSSKFDEGLKRYK